MDIGEVKILNIFKYKYGLKHVHSEERFYDLFKISRVDFIDKLSKIENPQIVEQEILKTIFENNKSFGRTGISKLKKSITEIKKKIAKKQRLHQFAEKYAKQLNMTLAEFKQSGIMAELERK